MLDLMIILARQKKLFLGLTICGTILSVIAVFILPSWFTARASFLPPRQTPSIGSAILSEMSALSPLAAVAGNGLGLKNPSDLYVAMLTSRTVEDAVIRKFDLQRQYRLDTLTEARRELESRTAVMSSPKDGLVRIAVEDRSPDRAAAMANAYVRELEKLCDSIAVTESAQRRLFFQKQVEDARGKLAAAEDAMKQEQQKTGLIQLEGQARALIESAAMLRAQVTAGEVQIKAMRAYATDANPELALAKTQLAGLKAELAKLNSDRGSGDLDVLISKGKLPAVGLESVRRLRDVKYDEAVFELLSKQFELAKLDEARQGGAIQIVDTAIPPDKRSFPQRGAMILLGCLATTLIALVAAVLRDRWTSAMEIPEQRDKWLSLTRSLRGGGSPANS